MESGSEDNPELSRLRGLGEWMRSVGAVELSLGDLHIKLAPKPPVAPGRTLSAPDADEAKALADEKHEVDKISDEEKAHRRFWSRIIRSSGAPMPPFVPREHA